jgi:hypothetical protein
LEAEETLPQAEFLGPASVRLVEISPTLLRVGQAFFKAGRMLAVPKVSAATLPSLATSVIYPLAIIDKASAPILA